MRLGVGKETGPEGLHPAMPRELADVLERRLSISLARSCCLGVDPDGWKREIIALIS